MIAGMALATNPAVARSAPRPHRGIQIVLVVLVVVAAVCGVFWLVAKPGSPQLAYDTMRANYGGRTFSQTVVIDGGGRGERITGISVVAKGMVLVGPATISSPTMAPRDASRGANFPAHSRLRIETHFRVTQCQHPSRFTFGPIPLRIQVQRLWFTRTDTVVDHGEMFPDAGKACGLYH
jgi:hypothetical protein